MRLLDTIATYLGYTKAKPSQPAWLRAEAEGERWNMPDGSAARAHEDIYTRLSWVQIAVSAVAQSAAIVPLGVMEFDGEEREAIPNHALEQLLRRPNPMESRYEFMVSHYSYRRVTGNSYWWLNRATPNAPPSEIYILQPHRVVPIPDGNMGLRGYTYDPGYGPLITLEPSEVLHFKEWNPHNRFIGLSPLQALMVGASADLAAQQFAARFYGRDNAKMAGVLAFADPVDDVAWLQMRDDMRREHGDGKNRIMRLRNVGKGGVEWISTQLTQVEMQYLEQRQFTKEEIFSLFAPGLASALAINANEANSKTGDAVLTTRAVWPLLVSTAEKITADLLPVYGDNLICEPEDIRHKDQDLEIRKQQAAGIVMTIDELRQTFYDLEPIGDERGDLLPAEVGKGPTDTRAPEDKPTPPMLPGPANADPDMPDMPEPEDEADEPDADDLPAAKRAELAQWHRKAQKRGAAVGFVPLALDDDDVSAVKLLLASSDVQTAFSAAPFAVSSVKRDPLSDAEQRLYDVLVQLLSKSGADVAKRILRGDTVSMAELTAALQAELVPTLAQHALEEMERIADVVGVAFDPAAMAPALTEWAATRVTASVTGMSATTSDIVSKAVARYRATPGMTRDQLETLLRPAFGARRAEAVAVTSITDAASQATNQYQTYLKDAGLEFERVWRTNNDSIVQRCPICWPLHNKPESVWAAQYPDGPPAHPRCRCASTLKAVV